MSVDLQVVFPQEVVPINAVRFVDGALVPTLDIIGQDFRSLDEVLINGFEATNVVVLSQTRMLVQVPEGLRANFILQTIDVLSRKLTVTDKSVMRFQLSKVPSKVRGLLRLIQLFLKILLTTPGTDIFSPNTGGAALKNIGRNFGKSQGNTIVSDFVVAVDVTSRQITAIQGRDPSIPRDERLFSARVLAANFNSQQAALIVSVELVSQAGRAAVTNIVV